MHQHMQTTEEYLDELAEYYLAASLDLQDKAKDILRKFRLKHNLTQAEAERILANIDPTDIKGIVDRLAKDPKNKDLKDELTTQAQAARIRNLESLFDQVKETTSSLAERFKKGASNLLKKLGLDAWHKAVFNLQKKVGSGWKVKSPSNKLIEKAVKTPWAGSGFSERIWGNTEELEKAVKKEIMKSLLTGRPIEEAAKAINDQFGKGMFNARRLMRTEAAYITNQMALEGYKSQGVEKYVYVAILDLRTSKICRSLDKKRFLVKNAKVGVNFPPMHPFCRSTTVPWVSDALLKKMKQKALDPKTGKRVLVPGDMTYEQWYKQFVQGQPAGDSTTQQRNLTRDQYDRYKERLGDSFPYTYDEFIKMKSDKGTWEAWQRKYKASGKITNMPGDIKGVEMHQEGEQVFYQSGNPIPEELDGDFSDLDELDLTDEERKAFLELRELSDENHYEYGYIIYNGELLGPYTSKKYGKVEFPKDILARGGVVIHSHTNFTPPSYQDLAFLLRDNIDEIGVIAYNKDTFTVSIGSGYKPDIEEFNEVEEAIREEVDAANTDLLKRGEITLDQYHYLGTREEFYRLCRHFGWTMKGGRL